MKRGARASPRLSARAPIEIIESIDASSFVKSGDKIYDLLDKFVEEIEEQNVVQVITDNGNKYILDGNIHLLNFLNFLIILSSIKCVKLLSLIIFVILCLK